MENEVLKTENPKRRGYLHENYSWEAPNKHYVIHRIQKKR